MGDEDEIKLGRRGFLRIGGTGVAVLGSAAGTGLLSGKALGSSWMLPDTDPETPDSHEIKTIKAMADTFIPNWDGDPGALESDAFATINDPYYGVNPYISEVQADLDDWCWWTYFWADFIELDSGDRTQALEERMGYHGSTIESWYKDAYEGILALTKMNYFGGLENSVGTNYIGYPGESAGYAPNSAAGAYHSSDTPKSIPDNNSTGVYSYIYVSGPGTVSQLKVSLNITHTWQGDLKVRLYAPDWTLHTLWDRSGGSADDIVLHDVDASNTFNGRSAQGWWRLRVSDHAGYDTGQLNFWSFKLRTNLDG